MSRMDLRFNAGVEYKGKVYASAININGLFQLDLSTKKVTYIKMFIKEKVCFAIHRMAFLYRNNAWFIPQNGEYIAVVNLDTLDIQYLLPPFNRSNKEAISKINAVYYSCGIIGEKYLYLVPTNIDTLLLINLDTRKLYPYYNVSYEGEVFLFGTYLNEAIYLWPYKGNNFVEINLKSNMRKRYHWQHSSRISADTVCYQNEVWFCPGYSDYILVMSLNTNEFEKIPLAEYYDSKCAYEQVYLFNNRMFFVPHQGNKLLVVDANTRAISAMYLPDEVLKNGKNGFAVLFSKDQMILASFSGSVVLLYERNTETFERIDISVKRDDLIREAKQTKDFQIDRFIYDEFLQQYLGLEKCFSIISMPNKVQANGIDNSGEKIWTNLKTHRRKA